MRMFFLNTTRPLFRNNVKLRQALNFAVDRPALVREFGRYAATPTDQYLPPVMPGFRNERIYPLSGPDLRRASRWQRAACAPARQSSTRAATAARLHRRPAGPPAEPEGDRPRRRDPAVPAPGHVREAGDAGRAVRPGLGRHALPVRRSLALSFDAHRNLPTTRSPKYDRLLAAAGRLSGPARYRAYGELDVQLARDAGAGDRRDEPEHVGVRLRPDRLRGHESVPRPDGGLPEVKRALAAALLAALGLAPAAGPQTHAGGTLRMAIPAEDVDSIDAAITGIAGTTPVVQATCASPMYLPDKPLPEGRRVVPELATRYPRVTNGGKTYTFTVRKDARFSTGAPVTAADVAHTINRALSPRLKSYVASFLTGIVGAQTVLAGKAKAASGVVAHGNTLTIRLTRPLGDFDARVARAVCVMPRYIGSDPEGVKAPVPTAAPYFIAEYVAGQRVVLERNPLLPRAAAASGGSDRDRPDPRLRDRARSRRKRPARLRVGAEQRLRRSRGGAPTEVRSQQEPLLRDSSELSPLLRAQYEPTALQGQHATPAGGELRDRPKGAAAGARPTRGLSHRPVPSAREPGIPRRAHLPAPRAECRTSAPARQRRHAEREGHPLHARRTSSAARKRRSSKRTSRRSGSTSRSRRFPSRPTSRRSQHPASRSTSPGPDGSPTVPDPSLLNDLFAGETQSRPELVALRLADVQRASRPRIAARRQARYRAYGSSTSTSRATRRRRSPTRTTTRSRSSRGGSAASSSTRTST